MGKYLRSGVSRVWGHVPRLKAEGHALGLQAWEPGAPHRGCPYRLAPTPWADLIWPRLCWRSDLIHLQCSQGHAQTDNTGAIWLGWAQSDHGHANGHAVGPSLHTGSRVSYWIWFSAHPQSRMQSWTWHARSNLAHGSEARTRGLAAGAHLCTSPIWCTVGDEGFPWVQTFSSAREGAEKQR